MKEAGKIAEFYCEPEEVTGQGREAALLAGCHFPEAYVKREEMIRLAKFYRDRTKDVFCELPFCHTLEAEAFGADIILGNGTTPPRGGAYRCGTAEELLALPEMDLQSERMYETLKVCDLLTKAGERVIFNLSGPLTICNSLADIRVVFKLLRKNPEEMKLFLEKLCLEELRLVAAAEEAGVRWFSYADPAGAVSVIGPKMMTRLTEAFTVPFLKQAREQMQRDSMLILCPKTTFALLGTGHARLLDAKLPKEMTYREACAAMAGTVPIAGQMCMKRRNYVLKNQMMKQVELL